MSHLSKPTLIACSKCGGVTPVVLRSTGKQPALLHATQRVLLACPGGSLNGGAALAKFWQLQHKLEAGRAWHKLAPAMA
jgi:hypothetical protein